MDFFANYGLLRLATLHMCCVVWCLHVLCICLHILCNDCGFTSGFVAFQRVILFMDLQDWFVSWI